MNVLIFFLIVVSILAIGYGFIGWRLITTSQLPAPWNALAWGCLILLFLLPPAAFSLQVSRIENSFSGILSWLGYTSMGFVSLVFTLIAAREITVLVSAGVQKVLALAKDFFQAGTGGSLEADAARREFLMQTSNLAILGAAGILTGYGFYEARRKPAILEITVPIRHLHPDLEGFRILQITDIHAGLTVKRPFVEMVAEQVQNIEAELIAFTGDLADGTVPYLREHVDPLRHLTAPYGRFFVTGNHEYYSGAGPWIEEADRLGFTVLLNEHRVVTRGSASIMLAGVTDYSAGDFAPTQASDPAVAVEGAPNTNVRILLAHQPRSIFAATAHNFDLQISGHTHGGQFFPWNFLAAVGQPYIAGLHNHEGIWVYVSKGTGYWGPPVRLAARSEVTILKLVRDATDNEPAHGAMNTSAEKTRTA
jgi:predicted MPP superfamily phosphohydrolase